MASIMFALVSLTAAVVAHPMVVVPPMMGSVLKGNVRGLQGGPWYCPKNLNDAWIWEGDQFLLPPFDNCMAEYLTCTWNETEGRPTSRPETDIYIVDFGGSEGVRYIDRGIFGYHFGGAIADLIARFETGGYSFGNSMWGAPYDWRFLPLNSDYYVQLKELCERILNETGKRTTLMAYSGGCWSVQYFLANEVGQEWKDKYIEKVVLSAPSYGGSLTCPELAWTGKGIFPYADTESTERLFRNMPTNFAHMPNWNVYGDAPIIMGPAGEKAVARELRQFLDEHGKLDDSMREMWAYYEGKTSAKIIEDPGVDVVFLINSGIDTRAALNFNETWDEFHYVYGRGDGVVGEDTLYWGCKNWNSGHAVHCYDYDTPDLDYGHSNMMSSENIREDIFSFVSETHTLLPGNHVFKRTSNKTTWQAV